MSKTKSQPVPGLCAHCCADVIAADRFWVVISGTLRELEPGMEQDVLQDMASGEWNVNTVRVWTGDEERDLPMAAVALVGGTAVCAKHLPGAMSRA